MNSKLKGLDFQRKGRGCVVIDRRSVPPRFVGIIRRRIIGMGYVLCPFVVRGLEFSECVPEVFRSVERAENWIAKHAVLWNTERQYTRFNGIIYHLLPADSVQRQIGVLRLQLMVLLLVLSGVLGFFVPAETLTATVALKCVAGVFGLGGLANAVLFFRERL